MSETSCTQFPWCVAGTEDVDHEHYGPIGTTPATATTCVTLDEQFVNEGITYPTLGTGISYSETEDPAPFIWLHIIGGRRDEDVGLNVLEAARLVTHLEQAIEQLRGSMHFGSTGATKSGEVE